jgi:hypothetical protein
VPGYTCAQTEREGINMLGRCAGDLTQRNQRAGLEPGRAPGRQTKNTSNAETGCRAAEDQEMKIPCAMVSRTKRKGRALEQDLDSTPRQRQTDSVCRKPNWIGEPLGQEKTNLRCGHRITQAHGKMRGTRKIQKRDFFPNCNQPKLQLIYEGNRHLSHLIKNENMFLTHF